MAQPTDPAPVPPLRDSFGRETDHRTPCDEGDHDACTDPRCDCLHHGLGWMTQIDQYLPHDTPRPSRGARHASP